MKEEIENIRDEFRRGIASAGEPAQIEVLRIKYLGRKGKIQKLLKILPGLSPPEKPLYGKAINELKRELESSIDARKRDLKASSSGKPAVDKTLPGTYIEPGHRHPLTTIMKEINAIFIEMGFDIAGSPEIETEYYNFEALNIPIDHPSRDAFDTFYLTSTPGVERVNEGVRYLLRSQTSTVQIRVMEKVRPPLRIIHSGRVYRPDATDASHSFMFHQVEGFMVDENISFADLKGVLSIFIEKFFGRGIEMRFRPHYFPFTEPSAEVDISCIMCKGRGCRVCSRKGWLEILGCGMIHPNVLEGVKYNSERYTGFAFGMGVDRIAMLKYGIDDIRLLFENDLRFLRQF